jgi:metallo-beta-lactamase family protein
MHFVEVGGKRILLDCGLFQGHRLESYERNSHFPFDPKEIDAIVLSHAHIDHSGNLPGIVKQGFHGPIYCTPATRDLCSIMLADSAYLQEKDIEYLEEKKKTHLEPLYSVDDVQEVLALMHTIPYHRPFEVVKGIECTYSDAGHIIGAAISSLVLTEGSKKVLLTFTGDLGRKHRPLLCDPEYVKEADVIISESTYGDRIHEDPAESIRLLADAVVKTHARGGKIIIPAFSVGRTQDLLYTLHNLAREKKVPALPIYVDSPLSVNATSIYRAHLDIFNKDLRRCIIADPDALGFNDAQYITSVDDSKKLNAIKDSCIIISASGMCEGGRILHHLANNVGDERNTVLIVGFQAPDTLGQRLVDRMPEVKIYGEEYKVKAEVVQLHGMSAHGDQNDLLSFIQHADAKRLQNIYLVHGELDKQKVYKDVLAQHGYKNVDIPQRGQKAQL